MNARSYAWTRSINHHYLVRMVEAMKFRKTHILLAVVALSPALLTQSATAAKNTADVALTAQGTLKGQIVNRNNVPEAGTVVEVVGRKGVVAKVRTNKEGVFEAKLPRGGSYLIRTSAGSVSVRAWAKNLAPRKVRQGVLLVTDSKVRRGQLMNAVGANWLPLSLLAGFGGVVVYEAVRKGS